MKAITTQGVIADDGVLRLELSTGLSPGPAEIVVVVQQPAPSSPCRTSLSGKYARFVQSEVDAVAEVREIRR